MKIYFLHGKSRSPKDEKLVLLGEISAKMGFENVFIDNTHTKDPNQRAKELFERLKNLDDTPILVGASMGGYASVWVSSFLPIKGMFLLAPALYVSGYKKFDIPLKCEHINIVHGFDDDTIPLESSIGFAKRTKALLHAIKDDHSLNNSPEILTDLFSIFLKNVGSVG